MSIAHDEPLGQDHQAMAKRLNVLLLQADQLAAAFLPAYGNRVVKSPNIDALSENGVTFDSFYCASPLCAPSRFTMMAGASVSRIGAYDNAAEFASEVPTFAHYLRAAGYQTSLSGKMHFCGPDQLHGFEERLTTDIYPADFGWTPDWRRFDERPPWYHTMDSAIQAGACTPRNQIAFDADTVFAAKQKLFDIARGKDERPFFMVVSMTHPHDPYVVPTPYWNRYRDDEIDMPRVPDLAGNEDPHATRLRHVIGLNIAKPTDANIRAARRAYYGAISYVDDQIGTLVSTLGEAQLDRNTVIMVIADHGDMLGERGLWYKMNFYEPACRIPLIVHAPGRFSPRRVAGSASLLDLLPTFAALGNHGREPSYAAPIDGRSLLPALQGQSDGVRDEVIGEYLAEGAVAPIVMIRRGRHKFVHSPVDPDQLYDVAADPDERVNLATQAAHAALVAEFRAEVARRWALSDLNEAVL